jgi:hypothetical protein
VIDHQPNGDRNVFVTKELNRLLHAVLKDFEILLSQIGYDAAPLVPHGRVQHYEVDVNGQLVELRVLRSGRPHKREREQEQEQRKYEALCNYSHDARPSRYLDLRAARR